MLKNRSLQFKIVFSVVLYILVIGIIGNLFLYAYLLRAVSRKAERFDRAYMEAAGRRIERNLADVFSLGAVCANDPAVLYAVSRQERDGAATIQDALNAQEKMNAFLQANPINAHVDKLILFDNHNLFVQATGRQSGAAFDTERIRQLPLFSRFVAENLPWASGFGESISPWNTRNSYALLFRIQGAWHNNAEGFLYVETGIDIITDVFREYKMPLGIFAQVPESGEYIMQDDPHLAKTPAGFHVPVGSSFPCRFREEGRSYRLDRLLLENTRLVLYNQADESSLTADDRQILYSVLVVVLMSLFAAAGLAMALSVVLTRPIQAIINRIRKITEENDFSHDPEIEKQADEIGLIGRAVNEMSDNIGRFLVKTEEYYIEQKNAEIALLQTQINPHFLYNTLGSIHWMAKIQNNSSIADITHRLISLLRNIAAHTGANGTNIKISLAEELKILEDYTEVMSVRFMGIFEMVNRIPESLRDCLIPKLTLQPLVENAILHSIEPSGRFCVITLNAFDDGDWLRVTVDDTGVGMSQDMLKTIKNRSRPKERGSPSLNNIGIANVDERLKLLYGECCGLFFESRQGEFTRVTVKILKERQAEEV